MNSTISDNVSLITVAIPTDPPSKPDFDVPRYIYFYGLSVILPVGLLCNLLCFGTFLSSHTLRRTTTGHYLIALAVADTIFLLGEFLRWLNSFDSKGQILGIDFMETILFWCRLTFCLRYGGKLVSSWITVVISAERFVTVAFPLRVARISTPKIAKINIIAIYVICFALGSYPAWTIGLKPTGNSTYCGYIDVGGYNKWSTAILRVGSLLLPSAVIFIFTVLILIFLRRAKRRRMAQLEGQMNASKKSATSSVDFQLTVMLISVAIAFLVLRLPYTITFYLNDNKKDIWGNLDPWFSYRIYLANKICDMIAITNYAVNFFLYCLCGSAFRTTLCSCLTCGKGTKYLSNSSRTLSSKMSLSTSKSPATAKKT